MSKKFKSNPSANLNLIVDNREGRKEDGLDLEELKREYEFVTGKKCLIYAGDPPSGPVSGGEPEEEEQPALSQESSKKRKRKGAHLPPPPRTQNWIEEACKTLSLSLKLGDFLLVDDDGRIIAIIEHKTTMDLLSCLREPGPIARYAAQKERMLASGVPHKAVLFSGSRADVRPPFRTDPNHWMKHPEELEKYINDAMKSVVKEQAYLQNPLGATSEEGRFKVYTVDHHTLIARMLFRISEVAHMQYIARADPNTDPLKDRQLFFHEVMQASARRGINTPELWFQASVLTIEGMGKEKAKAIADEYKTMQGLLLAASKGNPDFLAELRAGSRSAKLGCKFSRKVYAILHPGPAPADEEVFPDHDGL